MSCLVMWSFLSKKEGKKCMINNTASSMTCANVNLLQNYKYIALSVTLWRVYEDTSHLMNQRVDGYWIAMVWVMCVQQHTHATQIWKKSFENEIMHLITWKGHVCSNCKCALCNVHAYLQYTISIKIDDEKSLTIARRISSDQLNWCTGFHSCRTHNAIKYLLHVDANHIPIGET